MFRRRLAYLALVLAAVAVLATGAVATVTPFGDATLAGQSVDALVGKALSAAAVAFALFGTYSLAVHTVSRRVDSKRRVHDVRNVLRLLFGAVGVVALLGVATERWLGVLLSLGVVGFAITFALQQPLLSFIGWFYVLVMRPYAVGDRVEIGDTRGDVIEVGFLVTTLWESGGHLVTSNQPSGRVVTVPNSQVLSSQVANYSTLFEYVWSEVSVQVAYESDVEFARETMIEVAEDHLGDEMAAAVGRYRHRLDETAVELEVVDRPTVNVVQEESWVELRLRFLARPRRVTRTKNALYERILDRFGEAPDRVQFPAGRAR